MKIASHTFLKTLNSAVNAKALAGDNFHLHNTVNQF